MSDLQEKLKDLYWFRLKVELLSTTIHSRSWLTIFQSIIKAVTLKTADTYSIEEFKTRTPVFHLKDKKFNLKILEGMRLNLEIIFNPLHEKALELWREGFIEYLREGEFSKRFILSSISEIEKRDINKLLEAYKYPPQEEELCLEFLTPLPFTPPDTKDRCYITKKQFIKLITERIKQLSGNDIEYKSDRDDWYLLPYYWHYAEIRHQSLSQLGSVKYINGCTGNLYIKGRWRDLLPFLLILEEVHAGTKLTYGRGYFRLHTEPKSSLTNFPDQKLISLLIIETLNKNDSIDARQTDEEKLSHEITEELKNESYTPSPPEAFHLDEGFIVERYRLKDLIVQQYLLNLFERPINMSLHKNVIGYRKGLSLQDGYDMIIKTINSGYEYIATFDIKSYYTCIRHDILLEMIERVLPQKDYHLLKLLNMILKTGYTYSGTYHERKNGLPMSSPLSPILANFYLHPLDEELNQETVCFRYADKFLLLGKTSEALDEAINNSKGQFDKLNLTIINLSKKHYTEGFKFCGLAFDGADLLSKTEYKKPLYITEPDVFVGISGDAIEVKKNKEILSVIPLHRISEIIITSRASFSTAMLEQAMKHEIPVSIQLNSGYHITTLKPDTKKYYELSFLHTRLYSELTQAEILEISKLIVTSKITSYIELFKKRYETKNIYITEYLTKMIEKAKKAETLNELRAYEALASRSSFRELSKFIKNSAFTFKMRIRKPADRINSLLNFGYYLLFSRLNATLRAVGLNPYLGFLHEPSNRYESLVADLQELFRARIDNFVLKLINLNIINEGDFIETNKGFRLNSAGLKNFIKHFEAEMDRKTAAEALTFEETLYDQVLQIKKWVLEEDELFFYVVMP